MNRVVHNALKIAFVLIFATVALIILPIPIITVLFERGEFSNIDSKNTASALAIYAFGLPAFVLHKIFTQCSSQEVTLKYLLDCIIFNVIQHNISFIFNKFCWVLGSRFQYLYFELGNGLCSIL